MSEQMHIDNGRDKFLPLALIAITENTRKTGGFDKQSLSDLSESILARGVLQPVIVRPLKTHRDGCEYELIAGERRVRASEMAGLACIPAIITDADDSTALEIQIVENIQREQLNLMDTARAVRKMLALHGKPGIVADKLKKSKAWVSKHLTITGPSFPAEVANILETGECQDLETLLMLGQIAKQADGAAALPRLIKDVAAGVKGRSQVRAALDALKNAAQDDSGDGEEGGGGSNEGADDDDAGEKEPTGPATITFNLSAKQALQFQELGGAAWLRRQLKKLEKEGLEKA